MPISLRDPWLDAASSLQSFPDHVLLDIARNDSAEHRYRKLAVQVLIDKKSPRVKHPDIQHLVRELEVELDGIEFEHPAPSAGPLVASITTETLYGVEPGKVGVKEPFLDENK